MLYGIAGKVEFVDLVRRQISLSVRSQSSTVPVNLVLTPKASVLRYKPDSIKYADAVASTLSLTRPGDMLRARGERSADGRYFVASSVISGAFTTTCGRIVSIDAEKSEIVVDDLRKRKLINVAFGHDSQLKRFPDAFKQYWVIQAGDQREMGAQTSDGGPRGTRPSGFEIDRMFERLPSIGVADLKIGDLIAVSSERKSSSGRVVALNLLAGIEAFFRPGPDQRETVSFTGFFLPEMGDIGEP